MKSISFYLAAVFTAFFAVGLCSCNDPLGKNNANPVEVDLKGADFEVALLDHEYGYSRDSVYCFEGIWKQDAFYFGYRKLDPMVPNILPDNKNQLEFRISSGAAGFQGVNASSSAKCINIVQDGADHTRYHLEWVAEGESTITFWNGEGPTRKEISFKATSMKQIPLKGLKLRINNGEDSQLYSFSYSRTYRDNGSKGKFSLNEYDENFSWNEATMIEIVGPDPLNATIPEGKELFVGFEVQIPFIAQEGQYKGGFRYVATDGHESQSPRTNHEYRWYQNFQDETMIAGLCPDFRWFDEKLNMLVGPSYDKERNKVAKQLEYEGYNPSQRILFTDLRERRIRGYRAKNTFPNGLGSYERHGYIDIHFAIMKKGGLVMGEQASTDDYWGWEMYTNR